MAGKKPTKHQTDAKKKKAEADLKKLEAEILKVKASMGNVGTIKEDSEDDSSIKSKSEKRKCSKCGVKVSSKNMARHIRTLHLNEKCFECSKCGKKFTTKNNMHKHQTKCVTSFVTVAQIHSEPPNSDDEKEIKVPKSSLKDDAKSVIPSNSNSLKDHRRRSRSRQVRYRRSRSRSRYCSRSESRSPSYSRHRRYHSNRSRHHHLSRSRTRSRSRLHRHHSSVHPNSEETYTIVRLPFSVLDLVNYRSIVEDTIGLMTTSIENLKQVSNLLAHVTGKE